MCVCVCVCVCLCARACGRVYVLIVPYNSMNYNYVIITMVGWLVGSESKQIGGFVSAEKCTVAPYTKMIPA